MDTLKDEGQIASPPAVYRFFYLLKIISCISTMSRHCANHFHCIISFNPNNNPLEHKLQEGRAFNSLVYY